MNVGCQRKSVAKETAKYLRATFSDMLETPTLSLTKLRPPLPLA